MRALNLILAAAIALTPVVVPTISLADPPSAATNRVTRGTAWDHSVIRNSGNGGNRVNPNRLGQGRSWYESTSNQFNQDLRSFGPSGVTAGELYNSQRNLNALNRPSTGISQWQPGGSSWGW